MDSTVGTWNQHDVAIFGLNGTPSTEVGEVGVDLHTCNSPMLTGIVLFDDDIPAPRHTRCSVTSNAVPTSSDLNRSSVLISYMDTDFVVQLVFILVMEKFHWSMNVMASLFQLFIKRSFNDTLMIYTQPRIWRWVCHFNTDTASLDAQLDFSVCGFRGVGLSFGIWSPESGLTNLARAGHELVQYAQGVKNLLRSRLQSRSVASLYRQGLFINDTEVNATTCLCHSCHVPR